MEMLNVYSINTLYISNTRFSKVLKYVSEMPIYVSSDPIPRSSF